MNRAERRRAAREEAKKGGGYSDRGDLKQAVTRAVEEQLIRKKARDDAILASTGIMLEAVYAAMIITMTEDYQFTQEQCLDLLSKVEDKTVYCLEHRDILDEAFEKTGIRIHFKEGIDRIERVDI